MSPKSLKFIVLFSVGFLVGLIGDYFHITSKTTFYNPDYIGFKILESAWWFPFATALAAVTLGFLHQGLQLKLDPQAVQNKVSLVRCLMALLAFLGLYALSAYPLFSNLLLHDGMMLLLALAFWLFLRPTKTVFILSLSVALIGTSIEIIQVRSGWFGYYPKGNEFFGVAIWTPFAYFASVPAIAALVQYLDQKSTVCRDL